MDYDTKQNTDNGLAFTLFSNFIKTLNFSDDVLGYYFYHLYLKDKFEEFSKNARELYGDSWDSDEDEMMDAIYKVNEKYYDKSEQVTTSTIQLYMNLKSIW